MQAEAGTAARAQTFLQWESSLWWRATRRASLSGILPRNTQLKAAHRQDPKRTATRTTLLMVTVRWRHSQKELNSVVWISPESSAENYLCASSFRLSAFRNRRLRSEFAH